MVHYDVFICHASEDKDTVARPLAMLLISAGVKVWYDEFALDVGDSLSRSIDKGLASSAYGAVIISKAFMNKGWTAYELAGLTSKEISGHKVILPIWHDISRNELLAFSPTLTDKLALSTQQQTIEEIAVRLLKVVKPDIYQALHRYALWRKLRSEAKIESQSLSSLKKGPIRHDALPSGILNRIKLVHLIVSDALDMSIDSFIDNFQRDLHPNEELAIWERIAGAFLQLTRGKRLQKPRKQQIMSMLLSFSMQTKEALERILSEGNADKIEALSAFFDVPATPGSKSEDPNGGT